MGPLAYPDLGAPPDGWTVGRVGHAVHFVPPGASLERSRARIVIGPALPLEGAPALEEVVLRSLEAENRLTGNEITTRTDAAPFSTASGLVGARLDLTIRSPTGGLQKRTCLMLKDAAHLYAVTYVADDVT